MIGLLATRMTLWAGGWWGTVKPFVGVAKKAKGLATADQAAQEFLGPTFGLVLGLTYLFGFLGFYLWDWTARPLRSSRALFLLRRLIGGTVLALSGFLLLDLWAVFFISYFDPEMGPAPPITLTEAGFYSLGAFFLFALLWDVATGAPSETSRQRREREERGEPPPPPREPTRWALLAWPALALLAAASLAVWWKALAALLGR